MEAIAANLHAVQARIEAAACAVGRRSVMLVAVSKGQSAEAVRAACAAGQPAFGESYAQEAIKKMGLLRDLAVEWHFIGPIQRNKTKAIAENFSWVHSVDRLRIAERLSEARPEQFPPLQVCLQVNISGEATKSGVAPGDLLPVASASARFPRLKLRGLMAIPVPTLCLSEQRSAFRHTRQLLDELNECDRELNLDTLSMGMSDDLEAAIAEGATIVRVGRAIFGERGNKDRSAER